MNITEKQQVVAEIQSDLTGAASILITDMTGIDVEVMNGLRSEFRKAGVKYRVAKNTLVRRAVAGTDVEALTSLLVGPTGMAWHDEEPSVPAKIVKTFLKENKDFRIKGGYIDGDVINGEAAIGTLSDIPSKDELRSQILGMMKMVPGKFLALVETPQRKFMAVLKAYENKQSEAGD